MTKTTEKATERIQNALRSVIPEGFNLVGDMIISDGKPVPTPRGYRTVKNVVGRAQVDKVTNFKNGFSVETLDIYVRNVRGKLIPKLDI